MTSLTRVVAQDKVLRPAVLNEHIAEIEAAITATEGGVAASLAKASNLSDLPSAATARSNLGLGTAATHAHTDYDAAGAASAAQSAAISAAETYSDQMLAQVRDLNNMAAAADAEIIGTALTRIFTGGVSRALQLNKLAGFVARYFGFYIVTDPKFGADATGAVDATTAIQATIAAANTAGASRVYFTPGTYTTSAALGYDAAGLILQGAGRGTTAIITSAVTALQANSSGASTVRNHCGLRDIRLRSTAANAKLLDATYLSYSNFRDCTFEVAGNNSAAVYGIGTAGGASPYYNTFDGCYLAATGGATGCSGYMLDQYVSGSTRRGPNGWTASSGRVASMSRSMNLQAANGCAFINISSESALSGGAHIHLGADNPHYSGTATAGTFNTLTDAGAAFANLTNGVVTITGGTGAGQSRAILSATSTVITTRFNWATPPDATSTYSVWASTVTQNTFVNPRGEGSNGANFIEGTGGQYDNQFIGGQPTGLGAGSVITQPTFSNQVMAFNGYHGGIASYTFWLDNIAANLTNSPLSVGGSSVDVLLPFDGDIVGIAVRSNAARTAGTLTVNPAVNGVVQSNVSAKLDANVTQSNVQMYPPRVNTIGGNSRRLGALVTTDASWAPTTADISVTIYVLHRA